MSFCSKCGSQLKDGESICTSCGANINTSNLKTSIKAQDFIEGLVRIKEAFLAILKNPFNGMVKGHETLNLISTYLFTILLSLSFGLVGIWAKSALLSSLTKGSKNIKALDIKSAVKFTNLNAFIISFFTSILSIAVVLATIYVIFNIIMKKNINYIVMLKAAILPFAYYLAVTIISNITIYLSLKLYVLITIIGALLFLICLYNNVTYILGSTADLSPAVFTVSISVSFIVLINYYFTMKSASVMISNLFNGFTSNLF